MTQVWLSFYGILCSVWHSRLKKNELHLIYKCKSKGFRKEQLFQFVTEQAFIALKPQAFIYLVIHEVKTEY